MVKKEKGKNMLNLGKELAKISKSLDQDHVDKVRQDQLKQNDLPSWIYFADKDKKEKKVNVSLLGEQILNDYTFYLTYYHSPIV